jgi:pimeloyl-ACP methyl ester carboxylesterase
MNEGRLEGRGIYYRTNDFIPGRPTLVFVHGVSGSSSAWLPYEARFSSDFNVLTFDIRGHGRSMKYQRSADYAIPHFVDDLRELLDHLGVGRCVLVAHSFATLIALEFVRTDQARVEAAVLISSDFDVGRRLPARILRAALGPVNLLQLLPFRSRNGRHVDYSRYPESGDWNVARMREDIGNTTWRVYLYCTRASYEVHADAYLTSIRVPVLLLHGRRDTIFPVENSIYMATRIPHVDLAVVDDADHIVVLNRPKVVSDAIERFLRQLPKPGRSEEPTFLGDTPTLPRVNQRGHDGDGNRDLRGPDQG